MDSKIKCKFDFASTICIHLIYEFEECFVYIKKIKSIHHGDYVCVF